MDEELVGKGRHQQILHGRHWLNLSTLVHLAARDGLDTVFTLDWRDFAVGVPAAKVGLR